MKIKDFGINLKTVYCPKCKEEMPKTRQSRGLYEILWGGWTCPYCDCKMDKYGNERAKNK